MAFYLGTNKIASGGSGSTGTASETDITNLKLNYLTEEQYQAAKTAGTISESELYFTPDDTFTGVGGDVEIGCVLAYGGSTAPDGYLLCDGSAVSRTTYADLFAVIGTAFGAGDGSTTFNLPKLDGKIPVGKDSSDTDFNTIGKTDGEKTHTLTNTEIPNGIPRTRIAQAGEWSLGEWGSHNPSQEAWTSNLPGQYDSPVGNQPHNNLQPYIVVNYIIKATKTTPVQAEVVNTHSTSTSDSYSCNYINNLNNYSTEERVVGEWLGKTLYRKMYTTYAFASDDNVKYLVLETNENINPVNCYGTLKLGTFNALFPTPDAGLGYISTVYKNSSNEIYITTNTTRDIGALECVLFYTKTTD